MTGSSTIALHEMENGQEADFFAYLAEKEILKTKEGKPYLRVTFRDAQREVRFPIWSDTVIYKELKQLNQGMYCKLRATYRVSNTYGPQLEIKRIRQAVEEDRKDGFNPLDLRVKSPLPLEEMFANLQEIAAKQLGKGPLHNLITMIFKENRMALMTCVGSRHHHHCYPGGLLEHTLSVTLLALGMVEHFKHLYTERSKAFSTKLVVAGAILHDIGKVREFELEIGSLRHTTEGDLIGHALLGRDILREAAETVKLPPEIRLRLEHIILSHQGIANWDAPRPPMSLEAMIVSHADSCDAHLGCLWHATQQDNTDAEIISKKNSLGYPLLKPQWDKPLP